MRIQHELIARAQANHARDSNEALTVLVDRYRPLVARITLRYVSLFRDNQAMQELMQSGVLGLVRAIRRFDLTRKHFLGPYAAAYIRAEIQEHVRTSISPVYMSQAVTAPNGTRYWRPVPAHALRETLDEEGAPLHPGYNVYTLCPSQEDPSKLAWGSRAEEPCATDPRTDPRPGPEARVMAAELEQRRRELVTSVLEQATEREREIMRLRHFGDDTLCYEAIGERYGLTRERIRQIDNKIVTRLRRVVHRAGADLR